MSATRCRPLSMASNDASARCLTMGAGSPARYSSVSYTHLDVYKRQVFDEDPIASWLTLSGVYNLRTHADVRGTDAWDQVDPILRLLIDGAAETSALDVVRAEDLCHTLNLRLVDLFHDVRLLVTPTTASVPPPRSLGGSGLINGTPDINWVKMTYPFNMTRSPAATVCVGTSSACLLYTSRCV